MDSGHERISILSRHARRLLRALRSDLGLTGSKFGCGEGLCGACTVVVGGKAARCCVTPLRPQRVKVALG